VRFVVKVIREDFVWFILIFHLSDHSSKLNKFPHPDRFWTLANILHSEYRRHILPPTCADFNKTWISTFPNNVTLHIVVLNEIEDY
jgi:hypothetical protein